MLTAKFIEHLKLKISLVNYYLPSGNVSFLTSRCGIQKKVYERMPI